MVARLHAEIERALASNDVKERLAAAGGEVLPGATGRFTALLDAERIRYGKLIRDAKICPTERAVLSWRCGGKPEMNVRRSILAFLAVVVD